MDTSLIDTHLLILAALGLAFVGFVLSLVIPKPTCKVSVGGVEIEAPTVEDVAKLLDLVEEKESVTN